MVHAPPLFALESRSWGAGRAIQNKVIQFAVQFTPFEPADRSSLSRNLQARPRSRLGAIQLEQILPFSSRGDRNPGIEQRHMPRSTAFHTSRIHILCVP